MHESTPGGGDVIPGIAQTRVGIRRRQPPFDLPLGGTGVRQPSDAHRRSQIDRSGYTVFDRIDRAQPEDPAVHADVGALDQERRRQRREQLAHLGLAREDRRRRCTGQSQQDPQQLYMRHHAADNSA